MRRTMAAAIGGLAIILGATPLGAQRAQVVNAGSEQALRIGTVTVSRPFGGTLVDGLAVVGAYRIGRERLWLVRGDGGPQCPARYVVVARRSAEELVTSTPFGTCAAAGRPRVADGALIVPIAGARYAYRNGDVRVLGEPRAARDVTVAPRCVPGAQVPAGEQAATLAAFEDGFPSSYGHARALKRLDMTPAELRDLLTGLACLSSWPAAQEVVPDRATALFADKRWGPRAFAMLDVIAEDRTTSPHLVALTRSFAAEMRYRVDRRTTI